MISSTSSTLRRPYQNSVRVDDQDRPLMMLLVAAHPRGADPRQLEALDLVAQALKDVLGALATAVVTPDRGADEDVQVA